jgi:single-stranded-DNA-specific exonuclease
MSLQREHLAAFSQAFDEEVRRQLQPDDLEAVFLSDGELATGDFNLPLAQQLRDGGPWGQAFPEPQFDGVFQLINQRIVGSKHLKMVVSPLGNTGQLLDAIAFNVDAATWPNESVQQVQLVYKLDVNEFRGQQSVQLIVSQLAAVSG